MAAGTNQKRQGASAITHTGLLRFQAQRCGPKPALWFRNRAWTFAELAETTERWAALLASLGVAARQRVAFCAPNSPLAVALPYAAWACGAVATPLSPRATRDEVVRLLAHSGASLLIVGNTLRELGQAVASDAGVPVFVASEFADAAWEPLGPDRMPPGATPRPAPAAAAVLAYTSGTTGMPKGVLLSRDNLQWACLACSAARGDTGREIGAALSHISHTPVFVSHVLCRLWMGASVVLFERFDVNELLEATERFGITDLTLIGGMVHDVVRLGSIPEGVRRAVRKVTVGGAATPMADKEALREMFPGAEIIEAYGQSEATDGVTMSRGSEVFDFPGTVGRTNPHVVVRIRRADGSFAEPGAEGEIVVAGPTVMMGYWRDAAATRAAIRAGWLHTGDVGLQDEHGFLYLTGRLKHLIITGGENVAPAEVEEVLRQHPGVLEVAVIGTPHPKWGEQVTAIVVPRPGRTVRAEELIAFSETRLAGFKKPRRIEFVESLPRNATNKVDLRALQERFGHKEPASGTAIPAGHQPDEPNEVRT